MSNPDILRLLTLLEQEHQAIQRADLRAIDRLMPRKVALLARLEANTPPDSPMVSRLREAARVNAGLFESLIAGVREARALLSGLREGLRGQTYGPDGARTPLEPTQGSLHRRA